MSSYPASPTGLSYNEPSGIGALRLQGRPLQWARAGWWFFQGLVLSGVGASLWCAFDHYNRLTPAGIPQSEGWNEQNMRALLAEIGLSAGFYAWYRLVFDLLFVAAFFGVALFIFWRRSDEWMALFTAYFLPLFGLAWITDESRLPPDWQLPAKLVIYCSWTGFLLFFLFFPDGRIAPRRVGIITLVLQLVQLPASLFNWLDPVRVPVFILMLGLCLYFQVYRYRKLSGPLQRQQTKWIVFGFTTTLIMGTASFVVMALFPTLGQPNVAGLLYYLGWVVLGDILFLPVPFSIGLAILRYRLWDIDFFVNRALVYAALSAGIAGIYIGVVGSLGSLLQLNGNLLISLVGAALVAVLFQPLREILQRAVNRLMYGERDEPYRVIARLGQRLENTLEPRETLTTIVETVAQALKAPYVAVLLKDGRTEEFSLGAAYGQPWRSEPPLVVPLTYRAENVGQLWLAPRSPRESYSPTDHRLLSALANQAGAALHAVQLTAVLQRQRERLVTAREEERRRVSRDLHDGFGPTMAGITLQIGVARSLIGANPAAAEKLLDELKRQTQGANADIRQLVYALRPPELDLGLFSALRSTATRYNQPGGMNVELDIPESCPPLPAAIEVAAYRIAQEALTNAIRHAGASKCWLRLELIPPALPGAVLAGLDKTFPALEGFTSNILQLEIVDDGCGLPAGFKPGVGLNSMRERAEELGGTCSFESRAEGGMRVLARLPFSPEEPGKE